MRPTKEQTDPALWNSADSRTNPELTTRTPTAATAKASGAAAPTSAAAADPVMAIASVGAMTPVDSDAVPQNPSSRRSAGTCCSVEATPRASHACRVASRPCHLRM